LDKITHIKRNTIKIGWVALECIARRLVGVISLYINIIANLKI